MRRRRGLGSIAKQNLADDKFKQAGNEMAKTQMEQAKSLHETFKTNLQEYARKYRKEIANNPQFRANFHKMCSINNVDPLASNKGFWAELLGLGNFYNELSVQIIDVCLSTRAGNGGLLELGELKKRLEKMRNVGGNAIVQEISEDDIIRSIKLLKPLGSGFDYLLIGNRKMVRSVPHELNKDQSSLLTLAQTKGYITKEQVTASFNGWSTERINYAFKNILSDGLCWIDTQAEPHEYWVYSFFDSMEDDDEEN